MGRILGLDLGTKTLGIAISDKAEKLALAYENFRFPLNYYKLARTHVLEVCSRENITHIALGYPLNTDGSVGQRALSAERFKADLLAEGSPPITLVNEVYTTLEAKEELRMLGYKKEAIKQKKDEVAAKYILESYLNKKENSDGER